MILLSYYRKNASYNLKCKSKLYATMPLKTYGCIIFLFKNVENTVLSKCELSGYNRVKHLGKVAF